MALFPTVHTHDCDYCDHTFPCETRRFHDELKCYFCDCVQTIVSDNKDNYEFSRLAFWCSPECERLDLQFDEDDDDLPSLMGSDDETTDGDETEEEQMPVITVPDDSKTG